METPQYFKFKILKVLYERQDGKCFYCNTWALLTEDKQQKRISIAATIEHVVPKSIYHTYDLDKLVMACLECNVMRQTMPFTEFIKLFDKSLEDALIGLSNDPLWRSLLKAPFKDGESMGLPSHVIEWAMAKKPKQNLGITKRIHKEYYSWFPFHNFP